ncbi:MAG TPA: hypothetical protein VIX15_10135 [Streptosporangiaceae bacterium]
MLTTHSPRSRRWAAAGAIACLSLLATACGSSGSPAASAPGSTSAAPTPASSSAAAGTQTAANTFLAPGQDINATPLHAPACTGYGCSLSGDSTAILYQITWTTWSATKAVGTGTYKLDACNPSCAAGPVDPVPTVVTFSQPVKVCSATGTHWVWSRASFTFPHGLPQAFQGQNAPINPWTFTPLITAAQQSCP